MFPVKHVECGDIAFWYDHEPRRGEAAQSARVAYPYTPFAARVVCRACGEPVIPGWLEGQGAVVRSLDPRRLEPVAWGAVS